VGQLFATFNTFTHVELCSKTSINSLTNTKYKNEDNTPPWRTPCSTLNHLDCVWFAITELDVFV
jgi:hypothetical protein